VKTWLIPRDLKNLLLKLAKLPQTIAMTKMALKSPLQRSQMKIKRRSMEKIKINLRIQARMIRQNLKKLAN
jgi:hypothetical protein